MTKILSIRMPVDLLDKTDAKAARLGLDRTNYIRSLVEEDLRSERAGGERRFASEDLIGIYEGPERGQTATNSMVRKVMRQRFQAKRERNR